MANITIRNSSVSSDPELISIFLSSLMLRFISMTSTTAFLQLEYIILSLIGTEYPGME